jgi:epoxyqueuosine reductase
MDVLYEQSSMIKAEASRLGFDGCGIASAEYLPEEENRLLHWLHEHFHGSMRYMENHLEKRTDPTKLVEGAKSVISVLLNYYSPEVAKSPEAPVISKYAYGEDYHPVMRTRLKLLMRFINESVTPAQGRAFVDSAPVLDRAWAVRTGLGWIGKNTNLISKDKGSFVFIGSLVVDIPLHYDQPHSQDYCGTCDLCLKACPTQAIIAPRQLDARRCISYLTIENKGEIDAAFRDKFRNRLFGCDMCQDVCPWNRKATSHQVKEFNPLPHLMDMTRAAWDEMEERQYNELFARSPIKRTGYAGLKRNLDFISDAFQPLTFSDEDN